MIVKLLTEDVVNYIKLKHGILKMNLRKLSCSHYRPHYLGLVDSRRVKNFHVQDQSPSTKIRLSRVKLTPKYFDDYEFKKG